jgi:uncharacterized protein (TIGR03067 family)
MLLAPLTVGAGAPSEEDVKKELQKFQGAWQAVSIQRVDGTQASEDEIRNTRLVVKGNKFTLTSKDATITGRSPSIRPEHPGRLTFFSRNPRRSCSAFTTSKSTDGKAAWPLLERNGPRNSSRG